MSTTGDVHVGDVGTTYKARIVDDGTPFDPTTATVKKLIFKTPDGVVTRDAIVTSAAVDGVDQWYLLYIVIAADITDGLHKTPGTYSWQGYLEFGTGEKYHTSVEQYFVKP